MPERTQDPRQEPQIKRSWTRLLGVWLWTPTGRYVFNLLYIIFFGAFVAFGAWNASSEHSITAWRAVFADMSQKTYEATTANRCIGWAILSRLDGEKWTLPEWCVRVIGELHNQPPPAPSLEEALQAHEVP